VVIVCWNAASVIEACLRSLVNSPANRPVEVLLVDNASSDGSVEIARRFGDQVSVIELDVNLGFAGGCNEGSRLSKYEYLLFLNSDVEACPQALENLCQFMDCRPEVGAAGGKLLGVDGAAQKGFNVRAFPTLLSAAFEILMVDKAVPENPVNRKQRMLDFSLSEASEVDQPAGACLLIRKRAFETVGLFDEKFHPAWFEDVDLCLRLKQRGFKVYFVPEARFRHGGGASLEHLAYEEFLSCWYKNLLRYFKKHHGAPASILLRALILVGMLERILAGFFMIPRPGLTRAEALAAYWRVIREIL